jgi:hypothetical protein
MFYVDNMKFKDLTPETDVLTGYNVFLDGTEVATNIPDLSFQLPDLVYGDSYVAGVQAVYDDPGTSDIVEVPFTYLPPTPDPPNNLTAEIQDYNDVLLTWELPGGNNVQWIGWDDGTSGNSIGLTNGGTFHVASYWDPAALAPYDGMEITQIEFFPNSDAPTTYELKVWTGANASTLVHSQAVTDFVFADWNQIELDTPVMIDASQELWFGYTTTHVAGQNPAGTDAGPAVAGYGDMISTDGSSWDSLAGLGFSYNWNLQAYVVGSDGKTVAFTPSRAVKSAPSKMISGSRNTTASFSAAYTGNIRRDVTHMTGSSRSLAGYKIYRDGLEIGEVFDPAELTYLDDSGLDAGDYDYYVTAIYTNPDAESEPSNEVTVTVTLPAPTGVTTATVAVVNVMVQWTQMTDTRAVESYVIYRDGVEVGTSTSGLFIDLNVPTGDYIYNVAAIFTGDHEGAWSDDVPHQQVNAENTLPLVTELSGNYPNPFNPTTTIKFSLNTPEKTLIEVYNIRGEKVRTLVDGELQADFYNIVWNGKDNSGKKTSSGVYFYKMKAGNYVSTKKMILMK